VPAGTSNLRRPWEAVQRRMLERLHEDGFSDLDFAHLNVFQYPGPQGARPSEPAARLGMTKQALNYLHWAKQLSPERFAQFRTLLLEVNTLT